MGEKIDNIFGEPQFLVGKVGDNEFTQPIIFGKCDKPKIEGDKSGIPFKKTWSGELSATFMVPSKVRQVKGNRRQRKAAAFANRKTCFGLFGECSARSKKADKKRKKRTLRNWRRYVKQTAILFARLREIDREMIDCGERVKEFEALGSK